MENENDRELYIATVAETAAANECLKFMRQSLQLSLAATGPLRQQTKESIGRSLKQFRGERLTLGVVAGLSADDAKVANAAFRQAIEVQASKIEAMLDQL